MREGRTDQISLNIHLWIEGSLIETESDFGKGLSWIRLESY